MSVGDSDRSADPLSPWDSVDEDLEDDGGIPGSAAAPRERAGAEGHAPMQGLSPQQRRLPGPGLGPGRSGSFRSPAMTPGVFSDVPSTDVDSELGGDQAPATDVDHTPSLVSDPVDLLAAELAAGAAGHAPELPLAPRLSLPSLSSIPASGPPVRPSSAGARDVEPETRRDVVPAPRVEQALGGAPVRTKSGPRPAQTVGDREQAQSWPTLPQNIAAPPEASPLPPPPRSGQQPAQSPARTSEPRAAVGAVAPYDMLDDALLTPSPRMRPSGSSLVMSDETQLVPRAGRRVSWQAAALVAMATLLVGMAAGFALWGRDRPVAAVSASDAPSARAAGTGDTAAELARPAAAPSPSAAAGSGEGVAVGAAPDARGDGDGDGDGDDEGGDGDALAAEGTGGPGDGEGSPGDGEGTPGDGEGTPGDGEGSPAADAAKPAAGGVCTVALASSPSRAQVLAGTRVLGQTPMRVKLPCGEVELTFRRARYAPYRHSAVLTGGSTTQVKARLERPKFELEVTSQPPGASVAVDGKRVGETPVTVPVAGYSSHVVVVSKAGHRTYRKRVYARKDAAINARLPRRR